MTMCAGAAGAVVPVLKSGQSVTYDCALMPAARIAIGPALLIQSAAPM